ncbi:MAG: hypothetical protein IJT18_00075 [Oscillospiraceae bacterium]|nr:hypothetical protein [Oscillospiraceae bacterium]
MKHNEREKKTLFQRADRSVWIFALLLLCVFGVMLCGNLLTDKFADDFAYVFSFADGTPVRSLSGLLSSMREHYRTVNGRVIAHAFVQVFENLPKGVFAAVNAGMFTLSLALGYTLCTGKARRSNFLLLGLFAAVWIYMPAFGQVNFWLDGACNYLWAQVLSLLFLLPYVRLFEKRPVFLEPGHILKKILFTLYAFVMGAYSENLSGAALFMAILLLVLVRADGKRKAPFTAALPILAGIAGYAAMIFSPGELQSKNAGFSALRLLYQTEKVADRFHVIRIVIVSLVVLFFLSSALHVDKKRMLLAGVLTCGGVGAGLIFALARFYPYRSLAGSMLLLTLACGVLTRSLLETQKARRAALCLLTLLTLSLGYWCPHGMKDVYLVHTAVAENRQLLTEQKEAGKTDIRLPVLTAETKYSAVDGLI